MKFYLSVSILVLILFSSFTNRSIDPLKNYLPLYGNIFVSKYEVRNIEYAAFLQKLVTRGDGLYAICKYDSLKWKEKLQLIPFSDYYHCHPAYDDFPVVNITVQAAKEYCHWLTMTYNSNPGRKYKNVVFRLPTRKEWKVLASTLPGHNLPWYGNSPYTLVSKKGKLKCLANIKVPNLIENEGYNYDFDGSFITSKVGTYPPNEIGIHDVIGNVAEMTEEGNIMGGSWDNRLEECGIDKTQNFETPDPRVGFRVIMEIKEK